MNVTSSKLDLDGMLHGWPATDDDEAAWEARAARIVEAATSRRPEDTAALASLLAAPDLAPEPGEAQIEDIAHGAPATGEHGTMAPRSGAAGAASASRPPEKKRPSLREIAERASQASGRTSSAPGVGSAALVTPLPSSRSALTTPLPSSGRASTPLPPSGRGSTPRGSLPSTSRGSSPSLRPAERVAEDSGVIDLNRLSASAAQEPADAAEQAQPGTADPLDGGRPAEVAAMSAGRRRAPTGASAPEASARRMSGGMIAGAAVAALGMAAAVTVMLRTPTAVPQQETAAASPAVPVTPAPPGDEQAAPTAPAAPAPIAAAPAAAAANAEKNAVTEQPIVAAEGKLAVSPKARTLAGAPAVAPAPAASAAAATAPKAEPGKVAAAPAATGEAEDLSSAMQAAVGSDGAKSPSVVSEAPVPASGPLRQQQNIPEQPSQGSVQAALGAVMGGARACVAGADGVSRAQITFSSSGAVSKVTVSGWAASNGQSSCVQSALKGANVGPFSKPSFSVHATIRP
ncbi:hypothetical protein SOCEGT47_079000 [Sorangium cellulosum]|uniref:Uncharacterized protein n=1 Tax=Sorangium cellulosum TaxID=56 RepID=A0A4P2QDS4_SORCE|nr:hypothetical protein [Sorangium cellulosum]AUX27313.1 hypothetical protein SOCEGT47_079000 [Sorangium cellulosum]